MVESVCFNIFLVPPPQSIKVELNIYLLKSLYFVFNMI